MFLFFLYYAVVREIFWVRVLIFGRRLTNLWLVIHQKNSTSSCIQKKEACSGKESAGWPFGEQGKGCVGVCAWGGDEHVFGVLALDNPLVMFPHNKRLSWADLVQTKQVTFSPQFVNGDHIFLINRGHYYHIIS